MAGPDEVTDVAQVAASEDRRVPMQHVHFEIHGFDPNTGFWCAAQPGGPWSLRSDAVTCAACRAAIAKRFSR
jgi:hypothetical protein